MELVDFGLHLGYTFDQIKQKRTNHPHNIENAALEVATEWWDTCSKSYNEKSQIILDGMEKIGKPNLVNMVREKMFTLSNEDSEREVPGNQNTNGNSTRTSNHNNK